MSEHLKLLRFYFWLLAVFTVGRWGLSLGGADYDKTHQIFSLVLLTNISSLYYGLLVRSFVGGGVKRAIVLGATLAIFIAMNWGFRVTLLSASATYLIGLVALLATTRQ